MGWETRRGDKQYFYRSQRLPDGRIRKQYFGCGLLAEVESIRLERKKDVQRRIYEEKRSTAPAESLLNQHIRSTTDVVHGLMISQGYTNERSRGWRRLPMITSNETANELATTEKKSKDELFKELAQAARRGDRSVIPALRKMMQEEPEREKNNGDLATQTQIHWIDLIAGQDLYRRECLLMKMAEFKRELIAESKGTLVEQMLVDQAISTWLQLYYHEDREATRPAENIQVGMYRLKKIESAYNRHMRSLSALVSLRAINFNNRIAQAVTSVSQDAEKKQLESYSQAGIQPNRNRIRDAFSRSLEPVPMN